MTTVDDVTGVVSSATVAQPAKERVIALTALFAILLVLVWHHRGPVTIDRSLLHGYVPRPHAALFRLASHITEVAAPGAVIGMGIAVAALVWRRTRDAARVLVCLAAPLGAGISETVLKVVVHRLRPPTAMLTGESGNGFPSGHAAGFAALAFAVALTIGPRRARRTATALALLLSVVIAATRVIVGAHYPTDVIGGLLLGIIVADVAARGTAVPALSRWTARAS